VEVEVASVAFLRGVKVIIDVRLLTWLSVQHLVAEGSRLFTRDEVGKEQAHVSVFNDLWVIVLVRQAERNIESLSFRLYLAT